MTDRLKPEREAEIIKDMLRLSLLGKELWTATEHNLHAIYKELAAVRRERDAYRAVLEGAEFREIPDLATKGTEFCKMVGIGLAADIQRRIQFTGWTST